MDSPSMITVVIDTREQEPYSFDPACVSTIRRALPAGDYSIEGLETTIAAERKSLEDYVSTIIHSRDRFAKELSKLAKYEASCIIVEASLADILQARYRSKAHPNNVMGITMAIIATYEIPVFFCSDRQCARVFTEKWLKKQHDKALAKGTIYASPKSNTASTKRS